ncbi:MAG TPA: DUF1501 domain-containing protein [Pirellulales bacterium]|jgi:uncharacterized protein (DUF1501 family)|nr:DUF1501 domain-containing protein [Pirellulales bacterium]
MTDHASRRRHSGSALSLSRRELLHWAAAGASGYSFSGWLGALAARAAEEPANRRRSCILLWMPGGPSQTDTFDLKPGHKNGGPFKEIATSVSGIAISEHLPKVAQCMEHLAIIRSMSTKEGDHTRATYFLRTGYLPNGPIQYPALGAALGKEMGVEGSELPNFVSIGPQTFLSPQAYSSGFLGSRYAPLVVGAPGQTELKVENLALANGVKTSQFDARLNLLTTFEKEFIDQHPDGTAVSHQSAYAQAVKMMRSTAASAFDLSHEPAELQDAYGRNQFGQGCLLARRLVEKGVPFIEVSLSTAGNNNGGLGWDSHQNNFDQVKGLSEVLDPGWSTLITDLKSRGLLETTTIVWMGEFGRTPNINQAQGRDHFPNAWSVVVGGGGIRGGQVIGRTSANGMTVEDRPVGTAELLVTVCRALAVDPMQQNMSNIGRPIRLVNPDAQPIKELLL